MKYFFTKNLHYIILRNTALSSLNLALFFKFGFIFIYKLYKKSIILNTMFNSKPVISSILLFTKKSNKIVLSKKAAASFLFLAPSTLPLIYKNSRTLLTTPSYLTTSFGGFKLLGVVA